MDPNNQIFLESSAFISRYNYNLIEQSFIERRPDPGAKYLNTMSINTIASSFRQHGLGVVSSSVNVCYKLLAKKFQTFTEFMAKDNVKSLLSRELRWFENQKNEGHNTSYPFDRAATFAQEFKKLETDSGRNKLDECRVIIAEIGNIIGLGRMIRAAKRRVFSNEMQFLSSTTTPAGTTAKGLEANEVSIAELNVNDAVSAILNNSDTDFVRAFVNVFRGVIKKSKADDNLFMGGFFFCIVPALSLCWMEASIQAKEMMHKKNITRDGYFTDVGFAVGLAFVLSVLDEWKPYESLNWFKSIQSKYAGEEEDLQEKKNAHLVKQNAKLASTKQSSWFSSGSADDKTQEEDEEMTILNLMGKRLEGNRREMAMLFFSLHGSQSFFSDNRST